MVGATGLHHCGCCNGKVLALQPSVFPLCPVLTAPRFYRFPASQIIIAFFFGTVSRGRVLGTGGSELLAAQLAPNLPITCLACSEQGCVRCATPGTQCLCMPLNPSPLLTLALCRCSRAARQVRTAVCTDSSDVLPLQLALCLGQLVHAMLPATWPHSPPCPSVSHPATRTSAHQTWNAASPLQAWTRMMAC